MIPLNRIESLCVYGFICCEVCYIEFHSFFDFARFLSSFTLFTSFSKLSIHLFCAPSYSGLRSGDEFESSSDDIGRLKSQDIGEGAVKIRCTFWRYVDNVLYGDIFGEF